MYLHLYYATDISYLIKPVKPLLIVLNHDY
nr:MAG TPA: hypothetical protein [Caudoviricetes sp.]